MKKFVCLLLLVSQSIFAQALTETDRITVSIPANQPKNFFTLPLEQVKSLCGDEDGCTVRLSMSNYGNNPHLSAPASISTLLFLNTASKQWRTSEPNTNRGVFGNNVIEHALQLFSTCYLTDGYYKNTTPSGDQGVGLSLLYWPSNERAGCSVTLID